MFLPIVIFPEVEDGSSSQTNSVCLQVYEMFVAGYQFQVLSPIFTCHWGLQNKKGRPSWRERQNSMNRRHFETFKSEVFARYRKDPLKMLGSKKTGQKR